MVNRVALHGLNLRVALHGLPVSRQFSLHLRLPRRWVSAEEVHGCRARRVLLSAQANSPDKGVSFHTLAPRKTTFLAINQMPKGTPPKSRLTPGLKAHPHLAPVSLATVEESSPRSSGVPVPYNASDSALRRLAPTGKQMLLMRCAYRAIAPEMSPVLNTSNIFAHSRRRAMLPGPHQVTGARK